MGGIVVSGVLGKLQSATAARREVTLILDPALEAQWRKLNDDLNAAAERDLANPQPGESLAMPASMGIAQQMEDIRDQVEASQVTFVFEALDWRVSIQLRADHPPRDGNRLDTLRGYNVETFTAAAIRRTCIEVIDADGDSATEIPESTWDTLLGTDTEPGRLSYAQLSELFSAASTVSDGLTRVPTSARSLLESQDSGASLARPGPGTSPRSGSKGGSRRGSQSSSTARKAPRKKAASSGS